MIFVCVFADPRDRFFDIDQVIGKRCTGRQAVVDVKAYPAIGSEVVEQGESLFAFITQDPCAAVNLHDGWSSCSGRRGRLIDVQVELFTRNARELDISGALYAFALGAKRVEQLAGGNFWPVLVVDISFERIMEDLFRFLRITNMQR